jgi:hypothetical protein
MGALTRASARAGQIGPTAARDDGADDIGALGCGDKRRSATSAGAEVALPEITCTRVRVKPVGCQLACRVITSSGGGLMTLRTAATSRSTDGAISRALIALAGLLLLGVGLWAMLAPESFYVIIATYPPYNAHFIHDIGAFQLGLGACLVLALVVADARLLALAGSAVGASAHFVSHLVDRNLGGQPSDPVTIGLFALLLVALTVWRARWLAMIGRTSA